MIERRIEISTRIWNDHPKSSRRHCNHGRLGAEYLPQVSLAALPGNNMMMYE
jgi:hypothetical protein